VASTRATSRQPATEDLMARALFETGYFSWAVEVVPTDHRPWPRDGTSRPARSLSRP